MSEFSARSFRTTPFDVLLRLAREGSMQAWGELLERFRIYILWLANHKLPSELKGKVDSSDFAQKTFLKALEYFPQFTGDSEEAFRSWLRRICFNEIKQDHRGFSDSKKRQLSKELRQSEEAYQETMDRLIDSAQSPRGAAISKEDLGRVQDALANLEPDHRTVIQLVIYEHLAWDEVGGQMGRSADAARKLFHRAIQKLKELLAPDHDPNT